MPVEDGPIRRFLTESEKTTNASGFTHGGLESVVARWFNAESGAAIDLHRQSSNTAAARLGHRLEIVPDTDAVTLFCADPVYQQMDINHATLADQSLLNLSAADANSLIASLNDQFTGDGLRFECDHPMRWYCQFDKPLSIDTISLTAATGRDVSLCRPTGSDARYWRSLLAEIEMILYSHPVNQQREARGELPVNSLWLWGGGSLPEPHQRAGSVYSDNFFTNSLASFNSVAVGTIADFSCDTAPALLVEHRLARAAATADVELRRRVIEELSQAVFAELAISPTKSGVFGKTAPVTLWCGGDTVRHLSERTAMQRWLQGLRKPAPFESFIESRAENSAVDDSFQC